VIDFKQPRLEIAASTIKLVNIVNVSDAKSKDDADLDNVSKVSAAAVVGLATFLDANPACFQIHSRETSFICAAPDLLKKNQWMRVISFVASNARLAVGRAGGGLFGLSMDLAPKSYFSEFSCFDESSLAVERDAKTAGEEWERSAAKRRESFSIRAPILTPKDSTAVCMEKKCGKKFGFFSIKHHCTFCGQVFCDNCAPKKKLEEKEIAQELGACDEMRLCAECVAELQRRVHAQKVMNMKLRKFQKTIQFNS